MIASAEIGPDGEVRFSRPLGDQRFLEPYSGLYWQVTAPEAEPFRSRSLWDRAINTDEAPVSEELYAHDTYEFPQEPLRVLQRDVRLPGSARLWRLYRKGCVQGKRVSVRGSLGGVSINKKKKKT